MKTPLIQHDASEAEDSYYPSRASTSAPVPSIKSDTPTRWHSTLSMSQSLSSKFNRKPVNTLLAKYKMPEPKFEEQEWELIEDLIEFLEKFKKIVELLSARKNSTMNLALVFRSEINRYLLGNH